MGKVNVESQPYSSSPFTHFSHPHPLYPSPIHNPQASPCSACGLQTQSPSYKCHTCNVTLHQSCAKLPKLIAHASHGGCTMSLLTKPIYPGSVFSCDACADKGFAWSYHCEPCSFDLHVTCAAKPLKIRHQAHGSCELHLTFENPYAGSDEFRCDLCQGIGSKQWLYRCSPCGFDVHMDCITRVQSSHLMHSASTGSVNYQPHQQHMLMHSASTGAINYHQVRAAQPQMPQPYNPMVPGVVMGSRPMMNQYGPPPQVNQYGPNNNINPGGVVMGSQPMMNQYGPPQVNQYGPNSNNNLGSNLMMSAVDGMVNGVFQGIGQTMAQDIMGGGGDNGGGGGGGGDGSGGDVSSY